MLIKFSFPADDFKFEEIGKAILYLIQGDQLAFYPFVCDSLGAY